MLTAYPTPITNDERAEWAAAAITAFGLHTRQTHPGYLTDAGMCEEIVSDLICDLLHFTARAGGDPARTLGRGWGHYEYEVVEVQNDHAGPETDGDDDHEPAQ